MNDADSTAAHMPLPEDLAAGVPGPEGLMPTEAAAGGAGPEGLMPMEDAAGGAGRQVGAGTKRQRGGREGAAAKRSG